VIVFCYKPLPEKARMRHGKLALIGDLVRSISSVSF